MQGFVTGDYGSDIDIAIVHPDAIGVQNPYDEFSRPEISRIEKEQNKNFMEPLNLLSFSHILSTLICILVIIYLPRYFITATQVKKDIFKLALLFLVIINDGFDFYKVGYIFENPWQRGLPLHMCDFSAYSILAYLFTKIRIFFVFAFFWGILGAGFALLTPDVIYGFPYFEYIQSHIGHSFILIGVSYALQVDRQKIIRSDF